MATEMNRSTNQARSFECKTCGKKFDTFQALGGHQGIHRKAKLIGDDDDLCVLSLDISAAASRSLHRCKMCMKEFASGQALGGHMTQHRLEKAFVLTEGRRQEVAAAGGLLKAEEGEEQRHNVMRSELVLAAKEWRLYF